MWPESGEKPKPLRSGLTTGTCATACCIAASERLFSEKTPETVTVTLPKGKEVSLVIDQCEPIDDRVRASTIKDAGDDPDVTHGARVFVEIRKSDTPGVKFKAGDGVGVVTRAGLELEVGEPAINRVPRQMMREHLERQALRFGFKNGFEVTVGVENGEALAQKTMNPRLGILGGLSILGTSGIVRPYSCAAWIASIHQGIDVANANGVTHIAASTGNTSEASIQQKYDMDEIALIEMGDFAGAVFKHLRKVPVSRLSICGGFGKITKLACGNMDLNSRSSSIDFKFLAGKALEQGGKKKLAEQIIAANTSMEAYHIGKNEGIDIADAICEQAREFACGVAGNKIDIEVWSIDRAGEFIGYAGNVL
jgi:cobalt-precorrin-5B (C1)-methyltransferase